MSKSLRIAAVVVVTPIALFVSTLLLAICWTCAGLAMLALGVAKGFVWTQNQVSKIIDWIWK